MTPRAWTACFVLAWIIVAVAYDLWAGGRWGESATISAVMADWAAEAPIVALAVGLLCGHWFWPCPRR